MKLTRKQLPPFLKLDIKFDMNQVLEAFKAFENFETYQDLNGGFVDAEYKELCVEKRHLHGKFLHEKEVTEQKDSPYNSDFYRQLSLTEYNGPKVEFEATTGKVSSYKASVIKDSTEYNPMLDERNYTRRKDICTGYWNEILDTFRAPVTRTRFAYLAPNFSIKPHIDYDPSYSIRVHLPIITNKDAVVCAKTKDGVTKLHMPADGSVYFVNTGVTHWVENNGNSPRVHLIISLNGQEDLHV